MTRQLFNIIFWIILIYVIFEFWALFAVLVVFTFLGWILFIISSIWRK